MGLKLITAPTVEPVDLATARSYLRIDETADDTLIGKLITAARQHYDGPRGILERALITQTWDYYLDAWPSGDAPDADWVRLPLMPVQSIASVTYTGSVGPPVTMDAAAYAGALACEPAFLYPVSSWPTASVAPGGIVIRFVAGYGDTADSVPGDLVLAILQNVAYWYENRETSGKFFPGDAVVTGLRWTWPV